jgi:hypothetical protein
MNLRIAKLLYNSSGGYTGFLLNGSTLFKDPLIAVRCGKHPSILSDFGQSGELSGLRKISGRPLSATE